MEAIDLQCDCCKYLLKGLPNRGNCPECGTPISVSRAAHRRRLRQQIPVHSTILLYVATAYLLMNISAAVFGSADVLGTFVVVAPALIGFAVLAAQAINAPRPFLWWAVASILAFLIVCGALSGIALHLL